jgi:hypothetical protein
MYNANIMGARFLRVQPALLANINVLVKSFIHQHKAPQETL